MMRLLTKIVRRITLIVVYEDTIQVAAERELLPPYLIFQIKSWPIFLQKSNFSKGLIKIPSVYHRLCSPY